MKNKSNIITVIESHLSDMTDVEQLIAHYFIEQALTSDDLSSQYIANVLHISQAALTRFAKKCGFNGYREFVFEFLSHQEKIRATFPTIQHDLTKRVFLDYDALTRQSHELIDEEQLQRVAQMIEGAERVYFFGKGSSGLAAKELKLRLMRLGVICEAFTERDSFAWSLSILDENCLVMGFSLSGQSASVIDSLFAAQEKGAKVVLFTTASKEFQGKFSDTIALASVRHLDYGTRISPQFPMLFVLDILYAYFLEIDRPRKEAIFNAYIDKMKQKV